MFLVVGRGNRATYHTRALDSINADYIQIGARDFLNLSHKDASVLLSGVSLSIYAGRKTNQGKLLKRISSLSGSLPLITETPLNISVFSLGLFSKVLVSEICGPALLTAANVSASKGYRLENTRFPSEHVGSVFVSLLGYKRAFINAFKYPQLSKAGASGFVRLHDRHGGTTTFRLSAASREESEVSYLARAYADILGGQSPARYFLNKKRYLFCRLIGLVWRNTDVK
ncbi:MAG: hypothetical protein VXZ77_04120 [Pseudomonadota bacterium]|nr:hypothetical protein [Pseudomonadota bacterium]